MLIVQHTCSEINKSSKGSILFTVVYRCGRRVIPCVILMTFYHDHVFFTILFTYRMRVYSQTADGCQPNARTTARVCKKLYGSEFMIRWTHLYHKVLIFEVLNFHFPLISLHYYNKLLWPYFNAINYI